MEQFKRAKVIMLPTNNQSNIVQEDKDLLYNRDYYEDEDLGTEEEGYVNQHLYIISDDEIKEGDWFIGDSISLRKCTKNDNDSIEFQGGFYLSSKNCKKIIATTDSSLGTTISKFTSGNKGAIDVSEKILLPQLSQQFINKYIEEYNKGNVIEEVLVKYENYILNQSKIGLSNITLQRLKVNLKDNTITIKKLKDSWSREEVTGLLYKAINDTNFNYSNKGTYTLANEWINNHL